MMHRSRRFLAVIAVATTATGKRISSRVAAPPEGEYDGDNNGVSSLFSTDFLGGWVSVVNTSTKNNQAPTTAKHLKTSSSRNSMGLRKSNVRQRQLTADTGHEHWADFIRDLGLKDQEKVFGPGGAGALATPSNRD